MLALPWVVLLLASSARARPGPGPTRAPPPDLHRFLADLSYLERAFPCTEAERACLEHGRLLHADGNCYRVREQGPCAAGEVFRVNKTEALRGGVLRGTCSKQCVGARQPLAATGECRSAEWVENEVCRSEWGLQPTVDIFGEWVCKCLTPDCAPAPSTPAPSPPAAPSPAPSPAAPPADASAPPPAATPTPPLPAGCCRAPDLSRPTPVPYYDDRLALFGFWAPRSKAGHVYQKSLSKNNIRCLETVRLLGAVQRGGARLPEARARAGERQLPRTALAGPVRLGRGAGARRRGAALPVQPGARAPRAQVRAAPLPRRRRLPAGRRTLPPGGRGAAVAVRGQAARARRIRRLGLLAAPERRRRPLHHAARQRPLRAAALRHVVLSFPPPPLPPPPHSSLLLPHASTFLQSESLECRSARKDLSVQGTEHEATSYI